ncbi:hypothetical protein TRFO_22911 [Tritrichomonas foetus]|uniref:Protein kinase domain-containing protein n=1 Tax=Tritrichomonas foetus TaxID=1144522 RepID=A0A1J4KFF5_9EUKA|nr:hypothetical protein TRFO_22911 [Tritrichomonas foetus]|eukprot:OHT08500.1 hypothetical protein TRFO_22911 [Tritrichomonas foetus]
MTSYVQKDGIKYTCYQKSMTACATEVLVSSNVIAISREVSLIHNNEKLTFIVTEIGFIEPVKGVDELIISNSIQKIKAYGLQCSSIKSLKFESDSTIEMLCDYSLYNCRNLHHLTLPKSLQVIGSYAFYDSSVKTINFENNSLFNKIKSYAFYDCRNLECITFPNTFKSIDSYAFYNSSIKTIKFEKSSTFESIHRYAFYQCNNLHHITFPSSLKIIGDYAFYNSSINTLEFEDNSSLQQIHQYTFYDCRNLERISISSEILHVFHNQPEKIKRKIVVRNAAHQSPINANMLTIPPHTDPNIDQQINMAMQNLQDSIKQMNQNLNPGFDQTMNDLYQPIGDSMQGLSQFLSKQGAYISVNVHGSPSMENTVTSSNTSQPESHNNQHGIYQQIENKKESNQKNVKVGDFICDLNTFIVKDTIGEGSYGRVLKIEHKISKQLYACKVTKNKLESEKEQQQYYNEIEILMGAVYPSILNLVGINMCDFDGNSFPVIITEYFENGSLDITLKQERKGLSPKLWNTTKRYINIIGIALGMRFLHSKGIVHRDLKSDNVLLDENYYPRICDFGLSRISSNSYNMSLMSTNVGTPMFMAPEIINGQKYDFKVDVYSFSFMVYELLSLSEPIIEGESMFIVWKKILDGQRPRLEHLPFTETQKQFLNQLWNSDPSLRPTFDEIVKFLLHSSNSDQLLNESFFCEEYDNDEVEEYLNLFI